MKVFLNLVPMLASLLLSGCAAPITYYSKSPAATKTAMAQFTSQAGTHSTIALYENPATCTGIQRVAFAEPGVDKTVYVANSPYLTFSVYVQFPGYPSFKFGSSMYSVPFESGDLRVRISYDSSSMYTLIERREKGGNWVAVKDAIERAHVKPFVDSGEWCKSSPIIQK